MADEEKLDKKAAKKAAKEAKKAEKNGEEIEGEEALDDEDKPSFGSRVVMFFIALLILVIWLAIFALIVKADVGGLGSTVLFPVLKDVPVVNQILPGIENYIPVEDDGYQFDSVEEAVARIKELEIEVEALKSTGDENTSQIAELEAQAAELAEYKAKEAEFEQEKEKFYKEVVFSDNAPDIKEYRQYYESIDPVNAEALYKQVVKQQEADEELADYILTYSAMKPKNAAAIFNTMTDNLKLVCKILEGMEPDNRKDILAAMDTKLAATLTEMMEP